MTRRSVTALALATALSGFGAAPTLALPAPDAPAAPAPTLKTVDPSNLTPNAVVDAEHARPSERGVRALRRPTVWGGIYTSAAGERVRITVSDSYEVDHASAQGFADFISWLVHGTELAAMTLHLAPPSEVYAACGGDGVVACYLPGEQLLVAPGVDASSDQTVEDAIAHEYGHHIARNRNNAPWSAYDWGPKRWATAANVCRRVNDGTAFPADPDHYELDPGEAFAEQYRVLNFLRTGATSFPWPVLDDSFLPTPTTLAALQEDVLRPWTGPSTSTVSARFARRGSKTTRVSLPLDGSFRLELKGPKGAYMKAALDGDSATARARITGTACGDRSVSVRVVSPRAGNYKLRVSRP